MRSIFSIAAIALVVIATTPVALAQATQAPLDADISRAFGFINGQRFTLTRIKKEFPDLALNAKRAEAEFDEAFGVAERNLRAALEEILAVGYSKYAAMLQEHLESLAASQPLTRELAANFIAEVEARANGKIPSPVRETLLTYQFRERPAEEVVRGYSQIFRTKGHAKAKGIDFQIRYPSSWKSEEGERPNIIQKFVSENGRGSVLIILMVKEIAFLPGSKATKKELDGLFTEKELRGMVPASARIISAKPITLDGQRGGMIVFDQTLQRLDMTTNMRMLSFVTLRGNKMIFVQCMVSTPQGKENELEKRFLRVEPIFKWVANSFVLQEQYE